jgi:probable HAF family extracellular repeat protein
MNRLILLMCLLLVLSSFSVAQSSHAFLWTASGGMEDLGTLPGWQNSSAQGINEAGQVVGYNFSSNGTSTAFGWSPSTGMRLLSGLSVSEGQGDAVNDTQQVVGSALTSSGLLHGFLWSRKDGVLDLGDLGGGNSSATAINNSGQVVGYSETSAGLDHAFIWTPGGGMQDLMTLAGKSCPTCQSSAYGINGTGVIVGQMGANGLGYQWAMVYKDGNIRNLGDLGGSGKSRGSLGYGINKAGQVVGGAYAATGFFHAFLWTASGGMQDLGTLPGSYETVAYGINDSGQVVGDALMSNGNTRAFMWTPTGGMQDLGTLPGGSNARAFGINDAGLVVGWSELH